MKIKLSVAIITFNEEKNIERCIKSALPIADEIIILDSFSTDKTEEICKKFEVKFFQQKFAGHIEQKNKVLSFTSHKHVLSLDADEALSEELCNSILKVKENWQADGYYFNRLTNYCGKWIKYCGWYPDKKLRLWDKTKGKWGGENPHDKFIMHNNYNQKHLKGDLFHYSYYTISDHINQINKFTEINSLEAYKKGKKASFVKILTKPLWKFIRDYFIKLGFLDGYYGFVISKLSAHATFVKYLKIKELHKQSK